MLYEIVFDPKKFNAPTTAKNIVRDIVAAASIREVDLWFADERLKCQAIKTIGTVLARELPPGYCLVDDNGLVVQKHKHINFRVGTPRYRDDCPHRYIVLRR